MVKCVNAEGKQSGPELGFGSLCYLWAGYLIFYASVAVSVNGDKISTYFTGLLWIVNNIITKCFYSRRLVILAISCYHPVEERILPTLPPPGLEGISTGVSHSDWLTVGLETKDSSLLGLIPGGCLGLSCPWVSHWALLPAMANPLSPNNYEFLTTS